MKKIISPLFVFLSLFLTSLAYAIPTLQIGVADSTSASGYLPYSQNTTNPTETDTAITTGNSIIVGGVVGNSLKLGGKYTTGDDWSNVKNSFAPLDFNGHGAILLITYSADNDVSTTSSLKISTDGTTYYGSFLDTSNLYFSNNHAPLQDTSVTGYAYFDIGNFSNIATVTNFADGTGNASGELKDIYLQFTGMSWAHFDVLAIETDSQGNNKIVSTIESNPGSHDVTWKDDGSGGGGGDPVPEPSTMILLGAGLASLGLYRRRARK